MRDNKKKIKIPQSHNTFFIIKKSENWKNTLDLIIDLKSTIDYFNLFIIVKSYLLCVIYPFSEIIINIKKENDIIISERIQSSYINKINYNDFLKWAQYRINYDLKYCKEGDFYCFSFISNSLVIEDSDLNYLKPIYPWRKKIYNEVKSIELKDALNEKKIYEKDKEIKRLKKKILILKKKHTNNI